MRHTVTVAVFAALLSALATVWVGADVGATSRDPLANPAIDIDGYLDMSREAARHRATRRVTEEEFLRMAREPNTIVLDARSGERFRELHVKGAVNLSFPDITVDSLARLIPDKNTRVLIYCNNNFEGAESPFPAKLARASLNVPTYITLYTYGYRNVYELGPLVNIRQSKLPFASGG
jgi:rhodanese-related sulfurtransferase